MVKIYNLDGTIKKEIKLPKVFSVEYRPDLIKRAVLAIQNNRRQPYGTNKLAGKRTSAHYHSRRHRRYTMMNREMARMKRVHGGPPAQQFRAKFVPQAVSGRRAHPPKPEKIWKQKINKKERILAIKSAIAASANLELVKKRHNIKDLDLPIIISDEIQNINKTKNLESLFITFNLSKDLERAKKKKVRAGKGKMRGRKYKKKKSFLIVISEDKGIVKSAKNLPGVDISNVKNLNAELLAPGTQPGRLTVWSESAIKRLGEIYG